ncbi:MAG: hypothetical protein EAZ91_12630 [Cytophagales bacterium]|nr:MAG: hypothetical protein EAZ91_12630 [Cytophagales bacterium]
MRVGRVVALMDLPDDWPESTSYETDQTYLAHWLQKPDMLTVQVPSSIVSRSSNYLIHTLHPAFGADVRMVENAPFRVDMRVVKGTTL